MPTTDKPYRPPSRQPGYQQPGRTGTVPMQMHVDPVVRDELKALAKAANMTLNDFLVRMAETTIETAKKDPRVAATLRTQALLTRKFEDPVVHEATRAVGFKDFTPT